MHTSSRKSAKNYALTAYIAMDSPHLDWSKCPLCGKENQCALEIEKLTGQSQPPCWCVGQEFPQELLEQVPVQRMACICLQCLNKSKDERA